MTVHYLQLPRTIHLFIGESVSSPWELASRVSDLNNWGLPFIEKISPCVPSSTLFVSQNIHILAVFRAKLSFYFEQTCTQPPWYHFSSSNTIFFVVYNPMKFFLKRIWRAWTELLGLFFCNPGFKIEWNQILVFHPLEKRVLPLPNFLTFHWKLKDSQVLILRNIPSISHCLW